MEQSSRKKRSRGRPPKKKADRLSVPRTIKFNQELYRRLQAMAKDEGDDSINSLVRRLCIKCIKDWEQQNS